MTCSNPFARPQVGRQGNPGRQARPGRKAWLWAACCGTALLSQPAWAETPPDAANRLHEPVFRVTNAKLDAERPAQPPLVPERPQPPAADPMAARPAHPLDPAITLAREGLIHIQQHVADYTCTLVKRERINGTLNDYEYMFTKVRNRKMVNGQIVTPFSVYMNFLKPNNIKGREVVYVEGQNNGKMMAHEGGAAGAWLPSVWLRPDGPLAMRGNLYPLTDVGIENLVVKLIERGERERQFEECEVTFHKEAKVNGRVCTLLQVMHPVKREHFEFYMAQIFIDDELNVPIRYAAYSWPTSPGGRPEVLEEYTYLNLQLNVGLTDADFDHTSANYNFTRQ